MSYPAKFLLLLLASPLWTLLSYSITSLRSIYCIFKRTFLKQNSIQNQAHLKSPSNKPIPKISSFYKFVITLLVTSSLGMGAHAETINSSQLPASVMDTQGQPIRLADQAEKIVSYCKVLRRVLYWNHHAVNVRFSKTELNGYHGYVGECVMDSIWGVVSEKLTGDNWYPGNVPYQCSAGAMLSGDICNSCPDSSWTLSSNQKNCTRPDGIRLPTSGEKQMVQSIFKDGIDFEKVRVSCGKYPFGIESLPVPSDDVAVAPDNTIHFSKKHCLADFSKGAEGHQAWFIHEMAHVWQYQLNYPTMEYGIKWAIRGTISNVYGYSLSKNDFSEYNMEQQGDILRDYYLVKYKQQVTPQGTVQDYERILSNFLKDPKNARNLPHVTP